EIRSVLVDRGDDLGRALRVDAHEVVAAGPEVRAQELGDVVLVLHCEDSCRRRQPVAERTGATHVRHADTLVPTPWLHASSSSTTTTRSPTTSSSTWASSVPIPWSIGTMRSHLTRSSPSTRMRW